MSEGAASTTHLHVPAEGASGAIGIVESLGRPWGACPVFREDAGSVSLQPPPYPTTGLGLSHFKQKED